VKYGAELGRAGMALFLAGALWLVVSAEETTASWVPVRVSLTLDPAVSLVENPPDVRAFVVGRRRDLFKLISSPPTIQRAVTDDDRDSVRIELRVQDLDLPTGADITVRDLRPRLLTFRLRRKSDDSRMEDLLERPRRSESSVPVVQPDTVLDSLARIKLVADSAAELPPPPLPPRHDSLPHHNVRER
jgi:hypothetical protein